MLADKVEIGDYVNYPVYYDNVNGSTLKGWRVISKNIDLDGNPSPGTVNLVISGVQLTYYHTYHDSSISIENLTTKFLETPFTLNTSYTYRKNGFLQYVTLEYIFKNEYTNLVGEKLQIRALKAEDIYLITGLTEMIYGNSMNLDNIKYNNLFSNGAGYWIASSYTPRVLWRIENGRVYNPGSFEGGIRPVVSLKSEARATSIDLIGAWNIAI